MALHPSLVPRGILGYGEAGLMKRQSRAGRVVGIHGLHLISQASKSEHL